MPPHLIQEREKSIREQTAKFYQLDREYSRSKPVLYRMFSGFSGSGKDHSHPDWLKIGAIHIRSDAVRKQMSGIALDQRGDELLYSKEKTERTY